MVDRHVRVTLSGYICRVRQRYPWEITGSTRDREGGWWLLLGNEDDAPNRGPRNPPHLQDSIRSYTQILMQTFEQARCTSHSLFPMGLLAALGIQRDR